jgi:RimJ/RimL family protein N-acetyltransferase
VSEEIRTERLLLRRFTMDDVPAMHRLLSDPRATRFWSTPPHDTLEQTEEWVRSEVEMPPQLSDDFVVTLDGELIGKLGCFRLPEIGYLFDPAVWGRGYASEAMAAFIERRRRLGSPELTADIDPGNDASLRLLARCGFVETHRATRTWQIAGEWHDSVYLRLDLTGG